MREVAETVETRIRARVGELLKSRADVRQAEFGAAIGRGYSWVSSFLAGTRNANDILLLVRIARFFGVTVGYLIGESDKKLDPGAATLLATYAAIDGRDRSLLLDFAASLRRSPTASVSEREEGADDVEPRHRGATRAEPQKPRGR